MISCVAAVVSHDLALHLAVQAAAVANVCDHAEHNETLSFDEVETVGAELRTIATEIARQRNISLIEVYAARLDQIERKNVLYIPINEQGGRARFAETWRDLQLIQAAHDQLFHPDVAGLAKYDQLRHYAFHLTKLAGAFARAALAPKDELVDGEVWERRFPDMLLFGIKLSTVVGHKLPDEPLPS
jgi:hypothetical protein